MDGEQELTKAQVVSALEDVINGEWRKGLLKTTAILWPYEITLAVMFLVSMKLFI